MLKTGYHVQDRSSNGLRTPSPKVVILLALTGQTKPLFCHLLATYSCFYEERLDTREGFLTLFSFSRNSSVPKPWRIVPGMVAAPSQNKSQVVTIRPIPPLILSWQLDLVTITIKLTMAIRTYYHKPSICLRSETFLIHLEHEQRKKKKGWQSEEHLNTLIWTLKKAGRQTRLTHCHNLSFWLHRWNCVFSYLGGEERKNACNGDWILFVGGLKIYERTSKTIEEFNKVHYSYH